MFFYVDEFPQKLHHPKESALLFPKLRGHNARSDQVLDRHDHDHDHDHARGEQAIRGLEHALLGFEMMGETDAGEPRRATFETAMHLYVRFYREHMRIEETEVLPLAEAVLGVTDWIELDDAFASNRDLLTGHGAVVAYQPLFQRIMGALQAASGVGSALEALAGVGVPRYA